MPEKEPITLMTYEEWEHEHKYREMQRKAKERRKRERLKKNLIISIKQKLMGLALVIGSIVIIRCGLTYDVVTGCTDATFAIITIPLGLMMIFTKKRWLY